MDWSAERSLFGYWQVWEPWGPWSWHEIYEIRRCYWASADIATAEAAIEVVQAQLIAGELLGKSIFFASNFETRLKRRRSYDLV